MSPAGRGVVAGLDIGGTKTLTVIADGGRVRASHRRITGVGDPATIIGSVIEAVRHAAEAAGIAARELDAIGIGLPGIIDLATGEVRHAVNLGIGASPL